MIDIEEQTLLMANGRIELVDAYEFTVPKGSVSIGGTTNPDSCGLVFPISGKATYIIDGKPYDLEVGRVLYAGAGLPLEKHVVGTEPWSYALIHYTVSTEHMERKPLLTSQEWIEDHFMMEVSHYRQLLPMLHQFCETLYLRDALSALKAKTLFYRLIQLVMEGAMAENKNEQSQMRQIKTYMLVHFNKIESVKQLADVFDMDQRQLSYYFKKFMGICPKKYLLQLRIKRAKELLIDHDRKVTEVARIVGYEDPFYFSRLFKRQTGYSPTEYRYVVEKSPWVHGDSSIHKHL